MAVGDRDAFGLFYDACAPLAYGVLRRMLDPEEAAEALQDVFVELWRRASEFDPGRGTPEAWVLVRARSRGIDRLRSTRRREEMTASPLTDVVPDDTAPNPRRIVEGRDAGRGARGRSPTDRSLTETARRRRRRLGDERRARRRDRGRRVGRVGEPRLRGPARRHGAPGGGAARSDRGAGAHGERSAPAGRRAGACAHARARGEQRAGADARASRRSRDQ